MNHFDEMTCLLYLEGQLDADHAEGVRTHAAGCAECRGLLRALQTESVWLRESLEADDESVPARLGASSGARRRAVGLDYGAGIERGRSVHGVERIHRTVASAGGAGGIHAGKFTAPCFFSAVHSGKDGTRCEA